ncbi:unnamed protein product [Porites lobata]|uniref:Uncharacterized protein n=1 Tax=Porites lobata TaxID=104759 RepID=A0ABN8SBI8_9CNID|nr:unnamed protein product [Porites lobata]
MTPVQVLKSPQREATRMNLHQLGDHIHLPLSIEETRYNKNYCLELKVRSQNLAGLLVFFFFSLQLRPGQQVEDYFFELLSTNNEMVSPICRA